MVSLLDDEAFVDFVLEKGSIPFVVRGSLECEANFNFAPVMDVRVSGPTFHLEVIGKSPIQEEPIKLLVRELMDEAVFPGEMRLPEKTINGIARALYALELWADFLCLAVGNPKIIVEVQRPMNPVIRTRSRFDVAALNRWADLSKAYVQLPESEKWKLASAVWWYRKACAAAYYSIFDSYTAYWNCLEILCNVSGSRINKGPEVDGAIQAYLHDKSEIKSGHILECYNRFVNYGIANQMKDALKDMLGKEQADQLAYQCFEVLPAENRLYHIRNDINHGNIHENSVQDYERVYFRGLLLQSAVMTLLYSKLGRPISLGMDTNALAARLSDPSFRATRSPAAHAADEDTYSSEPLQGE